MTTTENSKVLSGSESQEKEGSCNTSVRWSHFKLQMAHIINFIHTRSSVTQTSLLPGGFQILCTTHLKHIGHYNPKHLYLRTRDPDKLPNKIQSLDFKKLSKVT